MAVMRYPRWRGNAALFWRYGALEADSLSPDAGSGVSLRRELLANDRQLLFGLGANLVRLVADDDYLAIAVLVVITDPAVGGSALR